MYQGKGYSEVKTLLSMTNNKDLLDYIFYMNIMSLDKTTQSKLLVDIDSAMVNIGSGSGKSYSFN
jgi:hypothetical protein